MLIVFSLIVFFILLAVLVYVLGEYIAWIYKDEAKSKSKLPNWLKWVEKLEKPFSKIENMIYKFLNLDTDKEVNWKKYLYSILVFNLLLFILLILTFR
ncbi:MAG: potassium-transporting ATPase subunit KdpA, partial [Bacillota bacterium]